MSKHLKMVNPDFVGTPSISCFQSDRQLLIQSIKQIENLLDIGPGCQCWQSSITILTLSASHPQKLLNCKNFFFFWDLPSCPIYQALIFIAPNYDICHDATTATTHVQSSRMVLIVENHFFSFLGWQNKQPLPPQNQAFELRC